MNNDGFDFAEDIQGIAPPEFRFQQLFGRFLRGKWIILYSTVLMVAAMIAYTFLTKPVYQASSMVLVKPKVQGGSLPFADLVDASPNKITNELGILKSAIVSEGVAEALLKDPYVDSTQGRLLPIVAMVHNGNPTGTVESVHHIAGRVRQAMEFEPQRESDIIRITARSEDPREATILANTFAEVYQQQNLRASRTHTTELREFLQDRLKEQRGALTHAEDSVKKYMESSGINSLDGASNEVVTQLSQLEASRNAIDIDVQTLSQKFTSYQQELPRQESNVATTIGQANDPYIRLLQEQLARLEVQRDVIVSQNDPTVVTQDMYKQKLTEIGDQIAALRKKLQTRTGELLKSLSPESGGGSTGDQLGYLKQLKEKMLETKIEIQSLQTKKEALDRIIGQYERKLEGLPRRSLDLAKLQRTKMSTEKLYLLVEEKYNEASISEKSEFGYVSIIDRALVSDAPVSPSLQINLLLGLLMGLGLGTALVYGRDFIDVRVRTPEDLKRHGLISLAEVAPMDEELQKLGGEGKIPHEVQQFEEHLRVIFNPLSFVSESYRRLRTNLLHAQLNRPLKAIMVTSPNPYEGKSTTLCNLAITFAETQKKVLLVDADIRRPNVHACFGIAPKPGLTDLLYGKATFDEVVQRNVVENLDIISSGTIIRNPGKMFGSRNMQSFIDQMKQVYAWVFFDTPPLLVVNDSVVLSGLVDGTILVVSAGTTRTATLERAKEFLNGAGGTVLGAVLNKFDAKKTYGKYYGSYRYGHYGTDYGYYSSSEGAGAETPARTKKLSLKP